VIFTKAFAVLVVAVFTGAGVVACVYRSWNDAIYSFSAALLNFVVYFRPFQ